MSPSDVAEITEVFGSMAVFAIFMVIIFILSAWDIVWKAIGMWKAARRGDKLWFVLCMLLNTMGILPIIYIYAIANKQDPDVK